MHIAALTLELHLPGCTSLKEKRGRLKPLLHELHREFNVSAAEVDHLDAHQTAVIACVVVSNSGPHGEQLLAKLPGWIERRRPDLQVVDHLIQSY
jgi:uncharacterized protein YlxP (DUF503 family)